MLTLIRPPKSKNADDIERKLRKLPAAYNTIYKEASDITYLVSSGQVFQGDAISKYLSKYKKELRQLQYIPSDSREIG